MPGATFNLFAGKFTEQSNGTTSTATTHSTTAAMSGDFYSCTFNTAWALMATYLWLFYRWTYSCRAHQSKYQAPNLTPFRVTFRWTRVKSTSMCVFFTFFSQPLSPVKSSWARTLMHLREYVVVFRHITASFIIHCFQWCTVTYSVISFSYLGTNRAHAFKQRIKRILSNVYPHKESDAAQLLVWFQLWYYIAFLNQFTRRQLMRITAKYLYDNDVFSA